MLGAATRRVGCKIGDVGGLMPGVLGVFEEPFELLFPWILFKIDIYTSSATAGYLYFLETAAPSDASILMMRSFIISARA